MISFHEKEGRTLLSVLILMTSDQSLSASPDVGFAALQLCMENQASCSIPYGSLVHNHVKSSASLKYSQLGVLCYWTRMGCGLLGKRKPGKLIDYSHPALALVRALYSIRPLVIINVLLEATEYCKTVHLQSDRCFGLGDRYYCPKGNFFATQIQSDG